MKIALIIERMDPLRGGRETYTAELAEALVRRGHQVAILCQTATYRHPGVEVVCLGRRGLTHAGRVRRFIEQAARAARGRFDVTHAMLAMPGADLCHPHGGTEEGSRQANLRRMSPAGRLYARLTAPLNPARYVRRHLERAVARDEQTTILCVSDLVADQFRRQYQRTANVRVVFNGVRVPEAAPAQRQQWRQDRRAQIGARPGDTVFLVVATNFPLKGVEETIRAFGAWRGRHGDSSGGGNRGGADTKGARLVILGRTRVGRYRRLAAACGVGREVHFEPPTPDIFPWYSAADAAVLLTWYDPCSLVVLEAVRWGLPCLTTTYNGAAEVLADGAGIVVSSPADQTAVLAAMDDLADPARRQARADACLRAADRLSIDRHVDALLEVYHDVAARRGQGE